MYKMKHGTYASMENYKARFVAKGLLHVEGIDYDEMFDLVACYPSIRMIFVLAAQMVWRIQ